MATLLLKKSYRHKDLKEIKFHDLSNYYLVFTTMRDIGSKNHIAFPIRDAVNAGIITGPRILMAGQVVTTTAGHCNYFGTEADTLDEAVTVAVDEKVKLS